MFTAYSLEPLCWLRSRPKSWEKNSNAKGLTDPQDLVEERRKKQVDKQGATDVNVIAIGLVLLLAWPALAINEDEIHESQWTPSDVGRVPRTGRQNARRHQPSRYLRRGKRTGSL
jgi:hypothetical protein